MCHCPASAGAHLYPSVARMLFSEPCPIPAVQYIPGDVNDAAECFAIAQLVSLNAASHTSPSDQSQQGFLLGTETLADYQHNMSLGQLRLLKASTSPQLLGFLLAYPSGASLLTQARITEELSPDALTWLHTQGIPLAAVAVIDKIAIRPNTGIKGLGRLLYERWLIEHRPTHALAWVVTHTADGLLSNQPSMALHDKLGFTPVLSVPRIITRAYGTATVYKTLYYRQDLPLKD